MLQILGNVLKGCALATDPTHPAHPLILPTLKSLCFLLDPATPLMDSDPEDPTSLLQPTTLQELRQSLSSILDPSIVEQAPDLAGLQPTAQLMEEMAECSLEEHECAAAVVGSSLQGRLALQDLHSALCQWQGSGCGLRRKKEGFDPLREYVNVARLGSKEDTLLNQQTLMSLADNQEIAGEQVMITCDI